MYVLHRQRGRIGLPMPEALKGALVKLKDGKNDTAEGK